MELISDLVVQISNNDFILETYFYETFNNEYILKVDNYHNEIVLEKICSFCDINNMILVIENNFLNKELKENGFIENDNLDIEEYIIRNPNKVLSESIMLFSDSRNNLLNNMKEVERGYNIQSKEYTEKWYNEYIKILNSKEYQERRYKETLGVLINRNARKKRVSSKVGFAIVGVSKVQ